MAAIVVYQQAKKPCYSQLVHRVGENVRAWRRHRKLSQEALAEKIAVSTSHISLIERGQRAAGLLVLETIAKALGIDPSFLFN